MENVQHVEKPPRAKRSRFPRLTAEVHHGACNSPFYTVGQFAKRNPAFTADSLRWMIFNGASNGLDKSSAIIRNGRSIFIDEPAFFAWFRAQGRRGQ